MSYASIDEFKDAVGVADTYDDASLQRSLDAASTLIDNYCGRVFAPQDTTPGVRIFDAPYVSGGGAASRNTPYSWFFGAAQASGWDRLSVSDVASVSAIALDTSFDGTFSSSLPAGSWQLYPLSVGQPGVPGNYTEIRLRPNAPYAFWPGAQVRVTGLWGWPTDDAPPDAVRQATILLANRYFRRPSAPFGIWEAPQLGQLALLPQTDPDVLQLLQAYRARSHNASWVMV